VYDPKKAEQQVRFILDYLIVKDSGPGVPFSEIASTNAQLLQSDYFLVLETVLQRLATLNKDSPPERAEDLVLGGYCSPVRLFVKKEPHSVKKFATTRWRLISNLDLVDQVIEKLLFNNQNKAEIRAWQTCPSKPGIGLSNDANLQSFYEAVRGKV
jgi:hypothetical protein